MLQDAMLSWLARLSTVVVNFYWLRKGINPSILDAVQRAFDFAGAKSGDACSQERDETQEISHGRLETRRVSTIQVSTCHRLPDSWELVRTPIRVERHRVCGTKKESSTHYYVSSAILTAQEASNVVRAHWGIEHGLHWVLDVVFREDVSRVRCEHAAANYAVIRGIALNLLRNVPGEKRSIRRLRSRCSWNRQFLLEVLAAGGMNLVR